MTFPSNISPLRLGSTLCFPLHHSPIHTYIHTYRTSHRLIFIFLFFLRCVGRRLWAVFSVPAGTLLQQRGHQQGGHVEHDGVPRRPPLLPGAGQRPPALGHPLPTRVLLPWGGNSECALMHTHIDLKHQRSPFLILCSLRFQLSTWLVRLNDNVNSLAFYCRTPIPFRVPTGPTVDFLVCVTSTSASCVPRESTATPRILSSSLSTSLWDS